VSDAYRPTFTSAAEFDEEVAFLRGRLDALQHQQNVAHNCIPTHPVSDNDRGRWRGHIAVREYCVDAQRLALADFMAVVRGRLFPPSHKEEDA
jgi:hypothetical protein